MKYFLTGKGYLYILLWVLLFLGLYLTGRYDYLFFHSIAEIFSIVIAFGIFMIAWNTRRFLGNNYLLFIGIAFLFVGSMDFFHTLAYKGMGVFSDHGSNPATQLWIAARYMEAFSLFLAPLFFHRQLRVHRIFLGYLFVTILLLASVFEWNLFPVCFIEGTGLTPFKKISEYLISLILVGAIVLLFKTRKEFEKEVLQWIMGSIALTIISELNFTLYVDTHDLSNLIGHFFKIMAFYFMYKALIETGLKNPYDLLSKNLKQTEVLLREEKNRIQNYLDIAGVMLVVIDKDQRVSLINKKGCVTLGYNEDEIVGRNWFDTFLPERERPQVKEGFAKLISGEPEPIEYFENPILTKSGEEKFIAWHNTLLRDDRGNIVGTISSGEDITQRKQMEEHLSHLASFPELNPNPITELDKEGFIHYINPAAQRLFSGLNQKEMEQEWIGDVHSIYDALKNQEERLLNREVQMDGQWFQQVYHLTPLQNRIRIYGVDITERKHAEEALRVGEEQARSQTARLQTVLDTTPAIIWIAHDRECRTITGNRQSHIFLKVPEGTDMSKSGSSPEQLLHYRVFKDGVELMPMEMPIQCVAASGQGISNCTMEIVFDDGTVRSLLGNVSPMLDSKGQPNGALAAFIDISGRKQAEEALNKSKKRFEILSETASRLLTTNRPQDIVNELCQKVMTHLDCHAFFNYLADEEKGCLHLNAYEGIPEEAGKKIEWLDYGVAVCGCAAQDAARIVCENIPETPDIRTELVKFFGIKAYACHPLFSAGRVIGTLSFGTRSRTMFTEDDLSLMKTVADQVAIAMERIQLLENIQKSRDELEIRVRERTKELTKVNEELTAEIKERKRAEEALRATSLYARSLIEASLDPLVTISADGKIMDVNGTTELITGRARNDLIGSDFSDYFTEPEKAREGYKRAFSEGSVQDYPLAIRHTSGKTTEVLYNATVYKNEAGEVQGVFAAARDITQRKRAEDALRATSLYARSLIEASLDPLVTISADGKIMDVNRTTEWITGDSRKDLIGSDFSDYFTEPEKAREGYKRAFSEGSVRDYPLVIRHTSGKTTEVLYNATVYKNEVGEVQGVFAAARDITERKAAENRIQSTNALLNLFAKTSFRKEYLDAVVDLIQGWSGCRCVGIRVMNKHGWISYEAYVGFSREFLDLENALSINSDQCTCVRVITGKPDPQDRTMITPGGSFHCGNTLQFIGQCSKKEKSRFRGVCIQKGFRSLSLTPIRYREQTLGLIHLADEREGEVTLEGMEFIESVAPLIGEAINRFNLEDELRDSENRLRALSSQLLTAHESERKKVAMELHDGVGQMLTAIKFKTEGTLQTLSRKGSRSREALETIIPLIKQSVEEVRRIQMDLRPSTLDDLGILATLEWFFREYQKIYSHIQIQKEMALSKGDIPSPLKIVIYRVVQEALNNVAKHSGANLVQISLKKTETKIEMMIKDNGTGFDLENHPRVKLQEGMGLSSMQERVELSGGTFLIETSPGKGTMIRASWPVS